MKAFLFLFVITFCVGCQNDGDVVTTPTTPPRDSYSLYGINFGPYLPGQSPDQGSKITVAQLTDRMKIIEPHARWIRTFGTTDGLEEAGRIAHEMGLKSAVGAWLDSNDATNAEQIANLISAAKAGHVDMAIVGSEVLIRGDLSEGRLLEYVQQVRDSIPDSVLVTTADVCQTLLDHPAVIDAVDVVFVNHYPFWAGIKLDCAISALHACHERLIAISSGKEVIVSETGWPSCGGAVGDAVPSLANATSFFLNFISWAKETDVKAFYFEAFDEAWKAAHEGERGACWGIWDEDGSIKDGMNKVFDGKTVADNWSESASPGGPGSPTVVFTYVPKYASHENLEGEVWHARPTENKIAVYILVRGRWWTKPYFNRPLTTINCEGEWTCDVTTGGIDSQATRFIAFLVPNGYSPPSAGGVSSLPASLYDTALSITEINRLSTR